MSSDVILERLRLFLLWFSVAICAGTIVELGITGHYKEPLQYVPFVLCGLGALTALVVLARPQRSTLLALRAVMVVVAAGSALGIYEHVSSNIEFLMEIRPNATVGDVFLKALSGASPLLAPGALAVAALIALAATYAHPALQKQIAQRQTASIPN